MNARRILTLACVWLWLTGTTAAGPPVDDYQTITKTATATTAQSDTALWTPTTGNYFVLQGCFFSSDFPVEFDLEVSDVDVIAPVKLESYGNALVGGGEAAIYVSAKDAVLRYSTSSTGLGSLTASTSVTCWGYEIRE